MTTPTGPDDPGAQDECATCGHARWRHKQLDGVQVCTEYVDCACEGNFVELSPATRMARFVEAAQTLAASIARVRNALEHTMRATTGLYMAMKDAGLLPEDVPTEDTAGRDRDAPACPLDGEPLASVTSTITSPTIYRHTDGTSHPGRLAEVLDNPQAASQEDPHQHGPSCVRYGCPNPRDWADTQ
jgi:hypothetical protein